MSSQLYFDYLDIVKSHYSVDGLVKVWYDSSFLTCEMKETLQRKIITYIPDLGKHHKVEINETIAFQGFVHQYDNLMYKRQCDKTPDQCLRYFSERNDRRNVRIAIRNGATMWNWGMEKAAKGGHFKLVQFFINQGADFWGLGLCGAAEGGHSKLIDFFIERSKEINNWNWGLYGAAKGGNLDLVKFFIEKGACNWDKGIEGAVEGGHLDIVKFFIEHSPCSLINNTGREVHSWNRTASTAVDFGNRNIVEFLIGAGLIPLDWEYDDSSW